MPLWNSQTNSYQQSSTPGTLNTAGFYNQPNVPRNSQAAGIQGTDGRAYTGSVQGNELVENRLGNMLNRGDSTFLDNARQRGLQQAARRGLGNSSIAAGASERSAIESAMPIATQDAQTYLQTRMQNQGDLNANLMQERDISNRMLEAEYNRQMTSSQNDQNRADAFQARQMQLQMQREGLAFEGEQQGLSRQQQEYMSRLGYDQALGRGEQGYGFDLGRAEQGFGFDIGRMGYQYDLTDRNAGRDWQRTVARDNNTFGNERYNALLGYELGQFQNNSDFLRGLIASDPSIDPESLSGVYDFMDSIGTRYLGDLFRRYGIGGG